MKNNEKIFYIVIGIALLAVFYPMTDFNSPSSNLISSYDEQKQINSTNTGFVKPEHRLLKILNSVSSGAKIKFDGSCQKFIFNKNTIPTDSNEYLVKVFKGIISSINQISHTDYYLKEIENVYIISDQKDNRRFIVDLFIYDVKHYYTIRLIADIVIMNNEQYINYLNLHTGSNPTLINKYDLKFRSSGILLDTDMFHEDIAKLFDNYYINSFKIVNQYQDSNDVFTVNSFKNMYLPASVSPKTRSDLEKKDLSSYLEMYLPENQNTIQSPSFCNKYKIEWDKYGIMNETGKECLLHNTQTALEVNQPYDSPNIAYDRINLK
tara:strand:- start:325 stop:1290 length:966 start_codon:yes stop_codon:yes gene_type:complete